LTHFLLVDAADFRLKIRLKKKTNEIGQIILIPETLTSFKYEAAHSMTGNGHYVNMLDSDFRLKIIFKNSLN
jgi:hypothetical protein